MTLCECKCVKCGALFEFVLNEGDKIQKVHCPEPTCRNPFMVIMTMQNMGNRQLSTSISEAFHRITRIEEFLCEEMDDAPDVFHTEKKQ